MTMPNAMRRNLHPDACPPSRHRSTRPAMLAPALAGLAVLAALFTAAMLLPGAAEAACVCRCLDGKAKAICSSATDIPPICNATACPLDTRNLPPPVKPGCANKQVYNPDTGKHEWAQICQ